MLSKPREKTHYSASRDMSVTVENTGFASGSIISVCGETYLTTHKANNGTLQISEKRYFAWHFLQLCAYALVLLLALAPSPQEKPQRLHECKTCRKYAKSFDDHMFIKYTAPHWQLRPSKFTQSDAPK